jgi:cell wall-associated NlpC family hydrolase
MVGGLVAGTVATAGASTLNPPTAEQADDLTGEASGAVTLPGTDRQDPRPAGAAQTSLRSASLDELREQSAADRSEARSAPEGEAASVTTLLADSTFTGTTLEVQTADPEPVEPTTTPQPQPAEQDENLHSEAQQATPEAALQQPEPVQQQATEQTQPQAAPAPAVGGSLFDIAASYVGYPYVLYGTPPQAFDCSAYTWWVFKQAGIDIPRTVAGQKAAVTPVSDPQPGDLIFYNDWYHVGIYAGNGMTYEAMNPSTDVRYGPLLSNNVWYGRIG